MKADYRRKSPISINSGLIHLGSVLPTVITDIDRAEQGRRRRRKRELAIGKLADRCADRLAELYCGKERP